jgi:hypothetical protein
LIGIWNVYGIGIIDVSCETWDGVLCVGNGIGMDIGLGYFARNLRCIELREARRGTWLSSSIGVWVTSLMFFGRTVG